MYMHVKLHVHDMHMHVYDRMYMQVILTVPLAVLKANMVTFTPSLSVRKKAAIQKLGAGLVEKVFPVDMVS